MLIVHTGPMAAGRVTSRTSRAIRAAVAAAVVSIISSGAALAESTWDGGGIGTSWGEANNWNNNTLPASGEDVRFGSGFNSGLTLNAAGDRFVGQLIVDTGAAFNLANTGGTGNTIFVNSGDIVRTAGSTGNQEISSRLTLGDTGTWNIAGTGSLTLSNTVIAGGGISVEKLGVGTLNFTTGSSTITGDFAIREGIVNLDNGAILTATSSAQFFGVNVSGNTGITSTLNIRNGSRLRSQNGPIIGNGAVLITGNGSRWTNSGTTSPDFTADVYVGAFGTGRLTVEELGSFRTDNLINVGLNSGDEGTLLVQSGGKVEAATVTLGASGTARGAATVTGPNSEMEITGVFLVGGNVNGNGSLTVANQARVDIGTLALFSNRSTVTVDGGTLRVTNLVDGGLGGVVNLIADPSPGTPALSILGDALTLDYAGTLTGAGSIRKEGSTNLTLSGTVAHRGTTTVNGGTLAMPNGTGPGDVLTINGAGTVTAAGSVPRALSGSGKLTATGSLIIGDAARTNGVAFSGTTTVGSNTVLFLDLDTATLGGTVNLDSGGRVNSFNGINLTGTLKATGAARVSGAFTNAGSVVGPTDSGQFLRFDDDVSGAGSYSGNVLFSDGFSPGNSPAAVTLSNVMFDGTTDLLMELGGTTAGSQYDQLLVSGAIALDGALNVELINGFSPQFGDTFQLIQGTNSGGFDMMNLPALQPTLSWQVDQTASAFNLTVVPEPTTTAAGIAILMTSVMRGRRRTPRNA